MADRQPSTSATLQRARRDVASGWSAFGLSPGRLAMVLAAVDVAIGTVVLLGWIANLPLLTTTVPGLVAMKANVALSLVLLGIGLFIATAAQGSPHRGAAVSIRNALAGVVLAIALATLVEYVASVNLGIDQVFSESPGIQTPFPGRPPIPVALGLAAAALGTLVSGWRWRGFYLTQPLAVFVAGVGAVLLLGYAYGAQELISLGGSSRTSLMAGPALLVMGLALVASNPEHALVRQFVDPGAAGQVARRIGPAALTVVPVGALLRLQGEHAGLYDMPLGLAIMTVFEALILLVVGVWTASRILSAERQAREASLYARGLLEASLDPLVTISPEGKVTDVNKATELATGRSREELIGTDFADYFTEPELARAGYQRVLRDGLVRDYPLTIRHVSGSTMDVLYNATVYRDQRDEPQGVFAAARDVTERLALEAERARREAVLREQAGLIESAHDAILVRTFDDAIRFWNAGAERTYGWTADEAIGQITHKLLRTEFPEAREALVRALFEHGAWEGQLRHTTKDGRQVLVQSRQVVERDASGEPATVLEINRDVTEEVAAQRRQQEYAEELRRSNADLEQFAYVASHDLQEPLRMVTGFVGLLERRYSERLGSEAKEYIDFAVEGAHRMQDLINDLLVYSRVGTRGRAFEQVDLSEAVEQARENLRVAIAEGHAKVESDHLPTVNADRHQMVQLFQNLIGNAIKFHGPEDPRVRISSQRDGKCWRVFVKDNGIGIAPEHQDQIFEIFRRLHSREAYPGSGIGLAICKKIVERHGGQISVESEPGRGATFWFTISDSERSALGTES